ncbi:hypothetical protein JZ751_000889, partial [Albula glossodonta]
MAQVLSCCSLKRALQSRTVKNGSADAQLLPTSFSDCTLNGQNRTVLLLLPLLAYSHARGNRAPAGCSETVFLTAVPKPGGAAI